jgi:hypothetical protein
MRCFILGALSGIPGDLIMSFSDFLSPGEILTAIDRIFMKRDDNNKECPPVNWERADLFRATLNAILDMHCSNPWIRNS